jgi:hypothetical protein
MPVDDGKQYLHEETKPFEPYLSRSLKRQQTFFPAILHFALSFLALLAGRALWELHASGRPIAGLIAWAAFFGAAIAAGPAFRSKLKKRPTDKDPSGLG